jgi:hypothetical protein
MSYKRVLKKADLVLGCGVAHIRSHDHDGFLQQTHEMSLTEAVLWIVDNAVLRIQDPLPFSPLDPVNIPDHFSKSLQTNFLTLKIFKLFVAAPESFGPLIRDPGWKFRIRDKHPGSAYYRSVRNFL